jgi:AraC-like DNA-binding protein
MDTLAGLLQGNRAQGAFVLRAVLEPPWSLRIQDEAPLTLVTLLGGRAWVLRPGADPVQMRPGEVAVIQAGDPYVVADDPATAPQVVIHPGQRCTTVDGFDVAMSMALGVRTWGNHPHGSTTMLTGVYQLDTEVSRHLLRALPASFVVPLSDGIRPILDLLVREAGKEEPGQEAVLDRLLDVLLMTVVRDWFARPDTGAPGWFRAHSDPVVGPALRLVYNDPAAAWTVARLAAEVGVSRAGLARRFTELVGEPPISFLTEWRLTLAADLLRDERLTVAAVAARVGYATPFGLSTAFKRRFGLSPNGFRASLEGTAS